MKDLESMLKTFAEGLKGLAQGIETVAGKIEEISVAGTDEPKPAPKPKPKKAAAKKKKRAPRRKKIIAKKTAAKKKARGDASDAVLKIVVKAKNGVKTAYLKDETGFDDKKIRNIIYKLKKQGKIKSAHRGVYVKA